MTEQEQDFEDHVHELTENYSEAVAIIKKLANGPMDQLNTDAFWTEVYAFLVKIGEQKTYEDQPGA